jgi:hypothetical protein
MLHSRCYAEVKVYINTYVSTLSLLFLVILKFSLHKAHKIEDFLLKQAYIVLKISWS